MITRLFVLIVFTLTLFGCLPWQNVAKPPSCPNVTLIEDPPLFGDIRVQSSIVNFSGKCGPRRASFRGKRNPKNGTAVAGLVSFSGKILTRGTGRPLSNVFPRKEKPPQATGLTSLSRKIRTRGMDRPFSSHWAHIFL